MSKLKLTVNEFFNLIEEDILKKNDALIKDESINIDRFKVYKDSWRYRTFYQKGCTCAACGRKGTKFILKPDTQNPERAHFNLYSDDGVLMTKDHIIPICLGGEDSIDNFQTMCQLCNEAKGGKFPEIKNKKYKNFIWKMTDKNTKEVRKFASKEEAILKFCRIELSNKSWTKEKDAIVKTILRLTTLLDNGGGSYCGFEWEKINEIK